MRCVNFVSCWLLEPTWYNCCCDYGWNNSKTIVEVMISHWADGADEPTSRRGWWADEAGLVNDVDEAGDADEADDAKAIDQA